MVLVLKIAVAKFAAYLAQPLNFSKMHEATATAKHRSARSAPA